MDISNEVMARIFNGAADVIERGGWWASWMTSRDLENSERPACISNAISFFLIDYPQYTYSPDGEPYEKGFVETAAQKILALEVGDGDLGKVFDINDSKSKEEGPQWAIETLRRIAQNLSASALIEGAAPVTPSILQ